MREWRDELLQKPLVTPSKSLAYPKEIEVKEFKIFGLVYSFGDEMRGL